MPTVVKRPAAKRDLTLQFVWFAEEAGIDTARRFLVAADTAFRDLATFPLMGAPRVFKGKLAGTRLWRVPGFENILILYRPMGRGVAIERLWHAKRDRERVPGA